MRFRKIKYAKGKVTLEYELKNKKNDWDQYSLACSDEPNPEFKEALNALGQDVITLCELPENYITRILVTGVSLSYGGEGETLGATIISQMTLHKSNVALNLNTPHKPIEPYSEGGDIDQCLSEDYVERLEDLITEAGVYVGGNRAQGELFGGSEKIREEGLKKIGKEFHDNMKKSLGPGESVTISSGGKSVTINSGGKTS
jgi:hypothetical protein